MKFLTLTLLVIVSLLVVACAAPPSDVPSAQVVDDNPTPTPEAEETTPEVEEVAEEPAEEALPVEPDGGIGDGATGEELLVGETIPIDRDASTFSFEGYGPGKSAGGEFDEWEGSFLVRDGVIIGGAGLIQADSVNTGIGGLDSILTGSGYLNAEEHPEISVAFTEVSSDSVVADMTIRGVTQTITFPATVTENSISADFLVDMSTFGATKAGTDDEIRITFEFVA